MAEPCSLTQAASSTFLASGPRNQAALAQPGSRPTPPRHLGQDLLRHIWGISFRVALVPRPARLDHVGVVVGVASHARQHASPAVAWCGAGAA